MPLLDPDTVRTLVGETKDSEHTLDLRGLSLNDAQSTISKMLEQWPSVDVKKVMVRIDPATATSGETLFLPIGRQLLEARKQGLIDRMHTLPEADGGGFYVELPSRPRHDETS